MEPATESVVVQILKPHSVKRKSSSPRSKRQSGNGETRVLEKPIRSNKVFQEHWNYVESQVESLENKWFDDVLKDIFDHVSSEFQELTLHNVPLNVPVTAFHYGMSHSRVIPLFDKLEKKVAKKLSSNSKYYFLRLVSTEFPSIKVIVQKLCELILEINDYLEWDTCVRRLKVSKVPLVLMIENADEFPENTIPQLLQLFSDAEIRLQLIVGTSYAYHDMSALFPEKSKITFSYRNFSFVAPEDQMEQLFDKILYNKTYPLLLSGGVVKKLANLYLQTYSFPSLLTAFKLCLLHHYGLLERSKKSDLKGQGHPSLTSLFITVHVLSALNKHIPEHPLGLKFYQVYCNCQTGFIFKDENVDCAQKSLSPLQKLLNTMKLMYKNTLMKAVEATIAHLKAVTRLYFDDEVSKSQAGKYISNFELYLNELLDEEKENERNVPENEKKCSPMNPKRQYRSATAHSEHMIKVLKSKNDTHFSRTRDDVVRYVEQIARSLNKLAPTQQQEEFMFSDVNILEDKLWPNVEYTMTAAVFSPHLCLKCKCCNPNSAWKSGSSSNFSHFLSSSLPDCTILYKLILQKSVRSIKIMSLFEEFQEIVRTKVAKSPSKKTKLNEPAHEYIFRFKQAMSNLQHTGFLSHSGKRDEITRQSWIASKLE